MKGLAVTVVVMVMVVVEGVTLTKDKEKDVIDRLTSELDALLKDFLKERRIPNDFLHPQDSSLYPPNGASLTELEDPYFLKEWTASQQDTTAQSHRTAEPITAASPDATRTATASQRITRTPETEHRTIASPPHTNRTTTTPPHANRTTKAQHRTTPATKTTKHRSKTEVEMKKQIHTHSKPVENFRKQNLTDLRESASVIETRTRRRALPNVIYRRRKPAVHCGSGIGGSVFSSSSGAMAYISFIVNAIALVVNINNNINNNNNNNNLNSNNNVNSNNANLNVNSNNANQVNIMPPGGKRRRRQVSASQTPPLSQAPPEITAFLG
ncbi:putative uncharacterized protein DDB_G0282129 [Scylla paramamosain]|uniref:putative uncharacterized protein DDB_G0282129 n=1 Tax=Scylla paramamosain TaxID=85552 RepID=UPI003083B39F